MASNCMALVQVHYEQSELWLFQNTLTLEATEEIITNSIDKHTQFQYE